MRTEKYKNSLVLTYKAINNEGRTQSKSNTINNLNSVLKDRLIHKYFFKLLRYIVIYPRISS